MSTFFDLYAIVLLLASLTIFVIRYVRAEPPIMPYLVIACTCGIGNWLGETGGAIGALVLMVAASFLFLSCLLYPHVRTMTRGEEASEAGDAL